MPACRPFTVAATPPPPPAGAEFFTTLTGKLKATKHPKDCVVKPSGGFGGWSVALILTPSLNAWRH